MQFSWRSPGIQTIMSSNVFLEFDVDIKVQGAQWDFTGSKQGQFTTGVRAGGGGYGGQDYPQAEFADVTIADGSKLGVAPPQIAFGDGDAVGQPNRLAHPRQILFIEAALVGQIPLV